MEKDKVVANAPASLIELVNGKYKKIEDEMFNYLTSIERKRLERLERGDSVPAFPLNLDKLEKELQENFKQGKPLALKIWRWSKEMLQNDLAKKMMFIGHQPTAYNLIVFWVGSGPLGKDKTKLALSFRNGLIQLYDGRIFDYHVFRSAKHLAENLGMDTLREIWAAIDDDSVWKNIEQGFEYLKRKDGK